MMPPMTVRPLVFLMGAVALLALSLTLACGNEQTAGPPLLPTVTATLTAAQEKTETPVARDNATPLRGTIRLGRGPALAAT